jgi:hypothetical protein
MDRHFRWLAIGEGLVLYLGFGGLLAGWQEPQGIFFVTYSALPQFGDVVAQGCAITCPEHGDERFQHRLLVKEFSIDY